MPFENDVDQQIAEEHRCCLVYQFLAISFEKVVDQQIGAALKTHM